MNEYCENLISNGVPSWIVEEAYKFTIETLKSAEGLVGIDKENSELYRNVIIAAYIKGASATFNSSLKFEIMAKQLYVASQRVL